MWPPCCGGRVWGRASAGVCGGACLCACVSVCLEADRIITPLVQFDQPKPTRPNPTNQHRLVAACLSALLLVAGVQAAQALTLHGTEGLKDVPRDTLRLLEV